MRTPFQTILTVGLMVAAATSSHADIFRWDNGQLIPGTQGIAPGPGVWLDHRNLTHANLRGRDLTDSRFEFSNLSFADLLQSTLTHANLSETVVVGASFYDSTSRGFTKEQLYSTASYKIGDLQGIGLSGNDLSGWDFSGQNLAYANMYYSTLTDANLSSAVVTGTNFSDTTIRGFTKEHLYSTASYQAKNLQGIVLFNNDLRDWDFSGQVVTGADFGNHSWSGLSFTKEQLSSTASYAQKDLRGIGLAGNNLSGWDFSGQMIADADFGETTSKGFTKEQLYSTASYHARNLQGIVLFQNDLSGWDFSGQNLTNASLMATDLTNTNFTGAVVTGARVGGTGFIMEQLQSTASYQAKQLPGIELAGDLSGWDFSGQNLANSTLQGSTLRNANLAGANLTSADFSFITSEGFPRISDLTNANLLGADLTNANLGGVNLTNTNFTGAVVRGADFSGTTRGDEGFTKEQLYSTASYQARNLEGIGLSGNDLSGWDFSGQNLTNAFLNALFDNTNLTGADTRGAQLAGGIFRNAIQPDGTIAGLDLSADGRLVVRNYHGRPNQGLGPIPITMQDHMTVSNGGVLQLLFDADAWDSTISFQPGIPVTLGGTLELRFAPSIKVARQIGRTFRVFDWTGVAPTGQFQVVSPHVWDLTKLYTAGEVTLTAVSSDADHDGLPDAWELTYWPTTAGHGPLDDFDHDGTPELLELAFGLNPTLSDTGGLPPATNEGGYLTMTITRHPGVIYEIQTADTLEAGRPDSFSSATSTVLIDTATTLKVRDNYPMGTSSRRFIRARVTAAR